MNSKYIRIGRAGRGPGDRTKAGVAAGALLLAGSVLGWSFSTADTARVDAAAVAPPAAAATRAVGGGVD